MPNYNQSTRGRIADLFMGMRVDASPASILNGQNAVFNVVGGRVRMNALIGVVTTVIQTAATLIHWDFDADVGGDAPLCIDSADITADPVGQMYALPAAAGSALIITAGAYLDVFPATGWVLSEGALDLHASAARTGVIKWSVFYVPLDDGAYIEAA